MDRRVIAYADGPDCAASPPARLLDAACDVLLGWLPDSRSWLDGELRGSTVMAGYALAGAVADGRLAYLPTRLTGVPRLLEQVRPAVVVVPAVRRGDELAYTGSVGWAPLVGSATDRVVVEIDDGAPDLGAPPIELAVAATVLARRPPAPPPRSEPIDADRQIAEHVLSLLPPAATLQFGPGAVADAVVRAIDCPVGVWSGLLTDAVAELAARGLLREPAVGAYVWGGDRIADLCRAGGARLTSIAETHDPALIAAHSAFVALNTAVQVGLDGAVNVERTGGRLVAGMGGHPDFCAAAARAPGGLSVIALRASHRGRSNIVRRVDTVSTPRCDVDVIVTEHGVADLRRVDDDERARRIAAIAAPEHRTELEEPQR